MTLARGKLIIVLLVIGVLNVTLPALPTSAAAFIEPGLTGTWPDFANCPASVLVAIENGECSHAYTTGGYVQIGHSTVPISIPGDTLDLGVAHPEGVPGIVMSPPHGLLNGPAQPVPTGLLGSIGNIQLTGVTARLEWATQVPPNTVFGFSEGCAGASLLVTFNLCKLLNGRAGTDITLSARIHLLNPFLGPNCYIGSASHPIVIALTTGITSPPPPAKPIHGKTVEYLLFPSFKFNEAFGISLVNNTFAVPAASGCGTSTGSLIDASINHKLGLPSISGQNTIVINAVGESAPPSTVLEHGWTSE